MRTISSEAQAAMDSGLFGVRHILKVVIPDDDPFCIWDDLGSIEVDGDTYHGAAGKFTLTPSTSVQDLSVRNLDATLSGLDNDVAAMIDAQPWHQAPILIQRIIIATEAPQILHVMPEFSGALDQLVWREAEKSEMRFICESASRELSRSGSRTRSDADQRQRDADDGFYQYAVSAISQTVNWGRQPEKPQKQRGGGLFGGLF